LAWRRSESSLLSLADYLLVRDYRIEGRGAAARIVPIHQEMDNLDFSANAKAADQMRQLEKRYLTARENAVSRVRINLSLAIRNAFDRLQDDRASKAAA
jgi:hypothetical protein